MNFSKRLNLHAWLVILVALFLFGINAPTKALLDDPEEKEESEFKYEDENLISFVEANQEISELRREINNEIEQLVEDHGLTMDRFDQIARASQIGAIDEAGYSAEEVEAFNEVAPQITQKRREMRSMTEAIIMERGLTTELYREILNDYREDSELQAYVQNLMYERARQEAIERAIEERKAELIEEEGLDEDEIDVILEEEIEEIEEEVEEEVEEEID